MVLERPRLSEQGIELHENGRNTIDIMNGSKNPIPPSETFEDFIAIVRQLRRECPWDREQTHASIAPLLIEEAYEVKESIEEQNDNELKKELGDILLHSVMHSVIAEERNAFTLDDVIRTISRKLIDRHPHVYGDDSADDAEAVARGWEQIKLKEGGRTSLFETMAKSLPALQRAERVQGKAAGVGFDWTDRADVLAKVREEVEELEAEVRANADRERIESELGDLLFALVNYARFLDIAPEDALQRTTNRFIRRFQHIEQRLAEMGKSFDQTDLAEMDGLWNEAKEREKQHP